MVELEMANTRLKDFYDVWQLSRSVSFDGAALQQAVMATFRQRNTPLPTEAPLALTAIFFDGLVKQAQWKAFLRKGRFEDSTILLPDVVHEIAVFILPAVFAAAQNLPFTKTWKPGEEWQ
jgi:Nucleotidyl transferase AbiEii toxin, Type IV TA system